MKVSVIVPAYNCAGYIDRCLSSLFCQKGAELEIIVVNDGSTDNTLEKLSAYGDRIKLITTENGGAARARNTGLASAGGDFVMFLDSDDYLAENTIEILVQKYGETGADIIRFRYRIVCPDGASHVPEYQLALTGFVSKSDFPKFVYPEFMSGIKMNSVCISMFKKSVIDGLFFRTDMKVAEDAVFSLHAFTRAENALFLPDAFYFYYQTGAGLTGSAASIVQKYKDNFKLAFETLRLLKDWGMSSPGFKLKTLLRPVALTFDKLKRSKSIAQEASQKQ